MRGAVVAALCLALAATAPAAPARADALSEARSIYAGRTLFHYDSSGVTRITYFAPDGSSYRWRPNAEYALPMIWAVESGGGVPYLCQRRVNEGLGTVPRDGGTWTCRPSERFVDRVIDTVAGDPFDLASGNVPFEMEAKRYASHDVVRIMGGDPEEFRRTGRIR